jgi:hypothetical protein
MKTLSHEARQKIQVCSLYIDEKFEPTLHYLVMNHVLSPAQTVEAL